LGIGFALERGLREDFAFSGELFSESASITTHATKWLLVMLNGRAPNVTTKAVMAIFIGNQQRSVGALFYKREVGGNFGG